MFLLIQNAELSHMVRPLNFNTSHVSINQNIAEKAENVTLISIHLMFLLILAECVYSMRLKNGISIHLMFLLIRNSVYYCRRPDRISIHLMFLLIQRFYQLFRFYYISNSLKIPAFSNFFQV